MIVLGNPEFAIGMKFSGLKDSFVIRKREEGLEILKKIKNDELIIANVAVIKMIPELEEFKNVVSLPDNAIELSNIDDLKGIIKSAVGIELEVV